MKSLCHRQYCAWITCPLPLAIDAIRAEVEDLADDKLVEEEVSRLVEETRTDLASLGVEELHAEDLAPAIRALGEGPQGPLVCDPCADGPAVVVRRDLADGEDALACGCHGTEGKHRRGQRSLLSKWQTKPKCMMYK